MHRRPTISHLPPQVPTVYTNFPHRCKPQRELGFLVLFSYAKLWLRLICLVWPRAIKRKLPGL
jgi:hypothetical protein